MFLSLKNDAEKVGECQAEIRARAARIATPEDVILSVPECPDLDKLMSR
jgi:hypothetical protein